MINTAIDKSLIKKRFQNASNMYEKESIAQIHIHKNVLMYLKSLNINKYQKALEIGCGTGQMTRLLEENFDIGHWVINDLTDSITQRKIFNSNRIKSVEYIFGDAESIDLGDKYDLIISTSAIQWFYQPIEFIKKCISMLRPNGILMITTFGPNNLKEIKSLLGIGLDYLCVDQFSTLEKYIKAPIYIKEELFTIYFEHSLDVLKHLKSTGVTATSKGTFFWTKDKLLKFDQQYNERYRSLDNQLPLTYHPIYISTQNITTYPNDFSLYSL